MMLHAGTPPGLRGQSCGYGSFLVLLAAVVAGCSDDGGGTGASSAAPSTASVPPAAVGVSEPKLPAIQSVAKAGGTTIKASQEADWTGGARPGVGVGAWQGRRGL